MKLFKVNSSEPLIEDLEIAETFTARLKGLLGRDTLAAHQGLWIKKCSSIHTFFMRFPIDAIFIDKKMSVQKICSQIPSGTIRWGNSKTVDVIELTSGMAQRLKLQKGDQLHVGD